MIRNEKGLRPPPLMDPQAMKVRIKWTQGQKKMDPREGQGQNHAFELREKWT